MDLTPFRHAETVTVQCSPDDAYAVISDVGRMGELSPVATGGEYDDPGTGATPGAWFTGHNAIGEFTWSTRCRVDAAEPGKEFTFTNLGPEGKTELVRWSYTFAAAGDGTEVTETWEVLPDYVSFTRGDSAMSDDDVRARIDGMAAMARDGIPATLAKLKAVCEG